MHSCQCKQPVKAGRLDWFSEATELWRRPSAPNAMFHWFPPLGKVRKALHATFDSAPFATDASISSVATIITLT